MNSGTKNNNNKIIEKVIPTNLVELKKLIFDSKEFFDFDEIKI